MAISLLDALFSLRVDSEGFVAGLAKAEGQAESSARRIGGAFDALRNLFVVGVAVAILAKLQEIIQTTIQWGTEMQNLAQRMGMTTKEASILVGVMERYGMGAQIAARSMQILSMQIKQTTEAMDPFETRIGKALGALRDSAGGILTTGEVLELTRQKILGASSAMERLQISQAVFGTQIGPKMLQILTLTNAEWEKQKKAVEETGSVMDEAGAQQAQEVQKDLAALSQTVRGLTLDLGQSLLPVVTMLAKGLSALTKEVREGWKWMQSLGEATARAVLIYREWFGLVEEGAVDAFDQMEERIKAAADAATLNNAEIETVAERLIKAAAASDKFTQSIAAAYKLGIVSSSRYSEAVEEEVRILQERQKEIEGRIGGLQGFQRIQAEAELFQVQVRQANILAQMAQTQYQQEADQLKSIGAFGIENELKLMEQRLRDERIVGDERLKLEGEIYARRQAYAEDVIRVTRQLGIIGAEQEIAFRKNRALEELGKGNVVNAASEIVKVRDLAMQQAEQVMEFLKKIRLVSLTDEISFQKQKLDAVKGNAQEEMKILGQIADLDKQLYDQRLQFAMNYTQNIQAQYDQIMKAARSAGEVMTFERARIESERQLTAAAREAGGVLRGGGTQEQRESSLKFAEFVMKQVETMQKQGEEITERWKDAMSVAKDIFKAAGVRDVREPGGPSPTVGSLLGSTEGLATSGLAKGSEIPRLDTSFTDLAIRVRDVLLGTIPNIQNFSNALADATKKVSGSTGAQINIPGGGLGPGGGLQFQPALATGAGTPAQPGFGEVTRGGIVSDFSELIRESVEGSRRNVEILSRVIQESSRGQSDVATKLAAAIEVLRSAQQFSREVKVEVGIDPNSGNLLGSAAVKAVERELQP